MAERSSNPTILYVDDDSDTRAVIKEMLRRDGYYVIISESEEEALQRADDGNQLHADLILIDLGQTPLEAAAAGRRIRKQLNLAHIPIVVLAFQYGEEMEGQDIHVEEDEWVAYLEDAEQLQNLLHRLC